MVCAIRLDLVQDRDLSPHQHLSEREKRSDTHLVLQKPAEQVNPSYKLLHPLPLGLYAFHLAADITFLLLETCQFAFVRGQLGRGGGLAGEKVGEGCGEAV
jgi:hypothetical protein